VNPSRQQSAPFGLSQKDDASDNPHAEYSESLTRGGYRFTLQRREVYDALLDQRDHPTATDVFIRVKQKIPNISLATVYSCLETLSHAGLIRHVNVERGPARFCPNLDAHGHFFCTSCGSVADVKIPDNNALGKLWELPRGVVLTGHEIALRGICSACASDGPKGSANPATTTTGRRPSSSNSRK
jgi:Fur family peroxide stress response transcriptional regulator